MHRFTFTVEFWGAASV